MLTGHIHTWQRTCPAAKGGCVAAGVQAPIHVTTPSAGMEEWDREVGEREKVEEKRRSGGDSDGKQQGESPLRGPLLLLLLPLFLRRYFSHET